MGGSRRRERSKGVATTWRGLIHTVTSSPRGAGDGRELDPSLPRIAAKRLRPRPRIDSPSGLFSRVSFQPLPPQHPALPPSHPLRTPQRPRPAASQRVPRPLTATARAPGHPSTAAFADRPGPPRHRHRPPAVVPGRSSCPCPRPSAHTYAPRPSQTHPHRHLPARTPSVTMTKSIT